MVGIKRAHHTCASLHLPLSCLLTYHTCPTPPPPTTTYLSASPATLPPTPPPHLPFMTRHGARRQLHNTSCAVGLLLLDHWPPAVWQATYGVSSSLKPSPRLLCLLPPFTAAARAPACCARWRRRRTRRILALASCLLCLLTPILLFFSSSPILCVPLHSSFCMNLYLVLTPPVTAARISRRYSLYDAHVSAPIARHFLAPRAAGASLISGCALPCRAPPH